jgi:hypothetical protein
VNKLRSVNWASRAVRRCVARDVAPRCGRSMEAQLMLHPRSEKLGWKPWRLSLRSGATEPSRQDRGVLFVRSWHELFNRLSDELGSSSSLEHGGFGPGAAVERVRLDTVAALADTERTDA